MSANAPCLVFKSRHRSTAAKVCSALACRISLVNALRRRKEPIIAIGGGVCLDVAGLAANLYRRNTPVIKVCVCACMAAAFVQAQQLAAVPT